MKTKITNLLGGSLLFEVELPKDFEDKEKREKLLAKRAVDFIGELLRKEFSPTDEEIDKIVKADLFEE